jgi:YrhK-like protein
VGPFTTHVTYEKPDGAGATWSSRAHRKHASKLSRRAGRRGSMWWAPRRASWWIGSLFAIGSACFVVGPFPGYLSLVGSAADGITFFVGSIFFTAAAALQYVEAANADRSPDGAGHRRLRLITFEPRRIDWWATAVQLVGTLLFNVSTFDALSSALDTAREDRLVWAPDAFGSAAFLISGFLAYAEVCGSAACRPRRTLEWWIAAVNLAGCVLFGVSAVASYIVPSTGSILDLAGSNFTTALGALCFLAGSLLLLRESAAEPVAGPAGRPGESSTEAAPAARGA